MDSSFFQKRNNKKVEIGYEENPGHNIDPISSNDMLSELVEAKTIGHVEKFNPQSHKLSQPQIDDVLGHTKVDLGDGKFAYFPYDPYDQ